MRIPALALLIVGLSLASAEAEEGRRPNIVLIVADDLGYGETGAQGNDQNPTPHIDALATRGLRCTSAYVTASFCAPSRAGLLTGRYQTRFGCESNPVGAKNDEPGIGLPPAEWTLAERLRGAGYATALVGKWHLGGTAPYHPQRQGFDEFFGFLHEGHFYVPPPYRGVMSHLRRRTLPTGAREGKWTSPGGDLILATGSPFDEPPYDANNPILRSSQPVAEETYLTDAFTREAVDFVKRSHDRPFFLLVAYSAVHSPMQARRDDLDECRGIDDPQRQIFAGMLRALDRGVGAIQAAVAEAGLERETLFVFLSDHGGPTQELTSSNGPLRGGKGDLYEGGVRVPCLLRWDGQLPAGGTYAKVVSSLDLVPTALAAAKVSGAEGPVLDGVDLLPYLRGERNESPHETLYWRMKPKAALRHGDWKLVRPAVAKSAAWELYDLQRDLGERRNLAAEQPEVVADLVRRWETLDREMQGSAND